MALADSESGRAGCAAAIQRQRGGPESQLRLFVGQRRAERFLRDRDPGAVSPWRQQPDGVLESVPLGHVAGDVAVGIYQAGDQGLGHPRV